MGQYWKIANLSKREQIKDTAPYKLLEWSYVGNQKVITLCNLLAERWKGDEVVVVGDYTERIFEGEDLYVATERFESIPVAKKKRVPYQYIYNHAKREFVDISKCRKMIDGLTIHPLPLLLAGYENGDGCGDYTGDVCINKEFVGRWLNDVKSLELSITPLALNYVEFIPDFYIKTGA